VFDTVGEPGKPVSLNQADAASQIGDAPVTPA
jgi:hypothetical protein